MSVRLALAVSFLTISHSLPIPPAEAAASEAPRAEWNDPEDVALVSRAFDSWLGAVIRKDRATVEMFHDPAFRAGTGGKLLDKKAHVDVEMIVGNQEMRLVKIYATRRIGDILLVWSDHFIRAEPIPEIPELGLRGDWGGRDQARRGFVQGELSVWRFGKERLQCLAFASNRRPDPGPAR